MSELDLRLAITALAGLLALVVAFLALRARRPQTWGSRWLSLALGTWAVGLIISWGLTLGPSPSDAEVFLWSIAGAAATGGVYLRLRGRQAAKTESMFETPTFWLILTLGWLVAAASGFLVPLPT